MNFDDSDISAMLKEARAAQRQFDAAAVELKEVSATATSKDRMIRATVNADGELAALKFTGREWREMSATVLAGKIVEVVADAQKQVREAQSALFAGFDLAGGDAEDLFSGTPNLESMLSPLLDQFTKGGGYRGQ